MMSEEAIKKRQARAKSAAIEILRKAGYETFPSDNNKLCVICSRFAEIRLIRIAIDKISPEDLRIIKEIKSPSYNCVKEIWCRKGEEFEISAFLN